MRTYKTPNGKEITTFYSGRNLAVRFTSGGELPEELSGVWTNEVELDKTIQKYLAHKERDGNKQTGQSTK